MKKMIDIDVFDSDERIIVNKACEGVSIVDYTRSQLHMNLTFARAVASEEDVLALDLLEGLIAKVEALTDEDWDRLKIKIPFETYYDAESNVDEAPADEDA